MRVLRFLHESIRDSRAERLLTLLTPQRALGRSRVVRMVLAGATAGVLGAALATAVQASALMLMAMAVVYYLLTQVLGVKLEIDPRQIVQQAQRYAGPASAPN